MEHATPHHLTIGPEHCAGNERFGRLFLLPGSDGRARQIAEQFTDLQVVPSPRQHNVYLGRLAGRDGLLDVGTVATGMGCPSVDIIVTELVNLGARLFLRVGTAGSLQPQEVRVGDLVIATAAVRDEGCSDRYALPAFPAVADTEWVRSLELATCRHQLGKRTFRGVVHTKDSLFAREFGVGPRQEENRDYQRQLRALGVLASEMEAAHLFILAAVHTTARAPLAGVPDPRGVVRAGALLAVVGDEHPFADPAEVGRVEDAAISVALEACRELLHRLAGQESIAPQRGA
jgi:uridine phosphorylase